MVDLLQINEDSFGARNVQENFDLSLDRPEIVHALRQEYDQWDSEMVDPLWPTGFKLKVDMEWHGLDMKSYEFHI